MIGRHAVRWGMLVALAAMAATAQARDLDAVRAQVENSLLVKGEVVIQPDGSVSGVTIAREDQLAAGIAGMISGAATQWKFEPVLRDGRPVPARTKMSLRLMARPLGDGQFNVSIASVAFGDPQGTRPGELHGRRMTPPSYPEDLAGRHVSGTVYVLVRIGHDGKVMQAAVEQVNLRTLASEDEMAGFREGFAKSALAAARHWTFDPPSADRPEAGEASWTVRVPVAYMLRGQATEDDAEREGRWFAYLPGPRTRAPWLTEEDPPGFTPDALPGNGSLYLVGRRDVPRLLTPLQGG